jgi:hypothetical protein
MTGVARGDTDMGDRDDRVESIEAREVRTRPDLRALLQPLAHDDDALELVARLIELLAARSPKS